MRWTAPPVDPLRAPREHLSAAEQRRAVRVIAARHGLAREPARPFESGSDVVWSVGEHVVKLTVPDARWQIEAEARHAARVHGRLSVETPAALAAGALDGWPYVVLTRVPGVAIGAVWPELDHAERARLAAALGQLARQLHGLDAAREPDDWDAFRNECLVRLRARREDDVPPALAAEVAPFLATVGELPHAPRVLAHTELLDQHVLVEPRDGRYELSGLIDFADARLAPAEYEFPAPAEFLFRAEPGLFRAFLLAYGYAEHELTPACSARLLAWGLTHRYGSLARMLRAVAPARPGTLTQLARTLYPLAPGDAG